MYRDTSEEFMTRRFVSERAAKNAIKTANLKGDYIVLPIISSMK